MNRLGSFERGWRREFRGFQWSHEDQFATLLKNRRGAVDGIFRSLFVFNLWSLSLRCLIDGSALSGSVHGSVAPPCLIRISDEVLLWIVDVLPGFFNIGSSFLEKFSWKDNIVDHLKRPGICHDLLCYFDPLIIWMFLSHFVIAFHQLQSQLHLLFLIVADRHSRHTRVFSVTHLRLASCLNRRLRWPQIIDSAAEATDSSTGVGSRPFIEKSSFVQNDISDHPDHLPTVEVCLADGLPGIPSIWPIHLFMFHCHLHL